MRSASIRAGFSPGYAHNVLTGKHDSTVAKLAHFCDVNGLSFSYVLFGVDLSAPALEALRHIDGNPAILPAFLTLVGSSTEPPVEVERKTQNEPSDE